MSLTVEEMRLNIIRELEAAYEDRVTLRREVDGLRKKVTRVQGRAQDEIDAIIEARDGEIERIEHEIISIQSRINQCEAQIEKLEGGGFRCREATP